MVEKKELNDLVILGTLLISTPPNVPLGGEINNFESKISHCQDCINKAEGRCLSNGLASRFPSGRCGNYETPPGDWDNHYNVTFGPVIEGVFCGPKIIDTRPDLVYTEIEATLHKV